MKPIELWNGDCLDLMNTIPDGAVDLVVADLPYATTNNSWDRRVDLKGLWSHFDRCLSPSGAIAMTATQPFASELIHSQPKYFRHDIIWIKRPVGQVNAKRMPMRAHEHVLIFGKQSVPYNPQLILRDKPRKIAAQNGSSRNYSEPNRHTIGARVLTHKYPLSHQYFPQDNGNLHPTAKPIALLDWIIRSYSKPNELVLDPTMGSGSTCVAAYSAGRRCIGIEKLKNYYDIAVDRVKKAMSEPRQAEMVL